MRKASRPFTPRRGVRNEEEGRSRTSEPELCPGAARMEKLDRPNRGWSRALLAVLTAVPLALAACGTPGVPVSAPGLPVPGGSSTMTLKFSHVVARNTPKGKSADRFAELAREKSGGKIEVQVFANSELFKDAEELQALQDGQVHFIAPATGKFASVSPPWDGPGLPYIFEHDAAVEKFLDPSNQVVKDMFEAMRPGGLVGLAIWPNGWRNFTSANRALRSPADFPGQRILTTTKSDEAFANALGAKGRSLAFSDHFNMLMLGNADGQYNTWSNITTQKFHEIQGHATISRGGTYNNYAVATNARWWDGLDPESRRVLSAAMSEASAYARQLADTDNAEAMAEIRRVGRVEIYKPTDEEVAAFRAVALRVLAEWEPKVGKETLARLRSLN
jgi:C4-dicarboxylate-binding protein DctP